MDDRSVKPDEASPPRPGDPSWRGRTARRSSTPEAMAALRRGRAGRGWTQTAAARHSGVSRPTISLLERGQRRPSESVAEDLIEAYELDGADAAAVRAISVPLAGRDSPYRTGVWPAPAGSGTFSGTQGNGTHRRDGAGEHRAAGRPAASAEDWIEWARKKAEQARRAP